MYVGTNGELRRSREIAAQAEDAAEWREVEPLLERFYNEHHRGHPGRVMQANQALLNWWHQNQEEAVHRKDGSATDTAGSG